MNWSAKQYVAFEGERTRPVRDLVAALPVVSAATIMDLGCGPGNSTEVLASRYGDAKIFGIDSSDDMITAARKRMPGAQFAVRDIAEWQDRGPFDVILANAVLQWVPHHESLLPDLVQRLTVGGALAVQMPAFLRHPQMPECIADIGADGPWADKLNAAGGARTNLPSAGWYHELLRPLVTRIDLWRTTYYHVLSGAGAVVEWFKGSGLRPFLEPLTATEREAYLKRYTESIARAYPAGADGSVLLPFPRLFMIAVR